MCKRLTRSLARHFDEPQLAERADGDAGSIESKCFLELGKDSLAMDLVVHVDEVHDDDSTEVAKAQLAGDDLGGFQPVPFPNLRSGGVA